MANLKTKNVFIDTQVFDAAKLNFGSTAIRELVKLADAKFIRVFLTSITAAEIRAHITERIHEASAQLKRLRKEAYVLKNVAAGASIIADFDETAALAELLAKFDKFIASANVNVLSLDGVNPHTVFEDYFAKKPPFGDGKKKHEFPDAFAQNALREWCEETGESIYVVSRDEDWQSAAKPLIPLATLQEFIDAAVKDQHKELSERVVGLYEKNVDKVEKAIEKAFRESGFYTDDVDGDVNDVKITDLKLGDPHVLEVENGSATISVSVDVNYSADVSYLDDSEGIWDSEDHEWFYRPTKREDVEESEYLEAELYIEFGPKGNDRFDVSCNIGKDFRVTVLPTDYELK
jgi:hypothetical protein